MAQSDPIRFEAPPEVLFFVFLVFDLIMLFLLVNFALKAKKYKHWEKTTGLVSNSLYGNRIGNSLFFDVTISHSVSGQKYENVLKMTESAVKRPLGAPLNFVSTLPLKSEVALRFNPKNPSEIVKESDVSIKNIPVIFVFLLIFSAATVALYFQM